MIKLPCTLVALGQLLLSSRAFDDDFFHFEAPLEEDVDIYVPCIVDNMGFGGTQTNSFFTVSYFQEIEYFRGTSFISDIVEDLERTTLDKMLEASRVACPGQSGGRRRLQSAVGLSLLPKDEVLELDCLVVNTTTSGNECAVIDSAFEVYYIGESDAAFQESFLDLVLEAVSNGDLLQANDQIVSIAVTDAASYPTRGGGGNQIQDPPRNIESDNNQTVPIVIGALAGTLLIAAAAVAYRRTQGSPSGEESSPSGNKKDEETPGPAGVDL